MQNSETSFMFHPENAIHIKAFFDDIRDIELFKLIPFLTFMGQVIQKMI
jgi:TFIIF-interacting CTD phosphatase-like protein